MAKKIGLVLSGCGVYDGAEIHEAVLSMLALARKGYQVQCIAPNIEQAHVVNHYEGSHDEDAPRRNVMVEAARIARGEIKSLEEVTADDFEGLFFPGGFGAAKNLCSFAFDGERCKVDDEAARLIKECLAGGKPMGFVCIAPAVAAKVIGDGVELTIGTDEGTANAINAMGAKHVALEVHQAHVDVRKKVVSSPAYMLAQNILEAEKSINAAVEAFAKLVG